MSGSLGVSVERINTALLTSTIRVSAQQFGNLESFTANCWRRH